MGTGVYPRNRPEQRRGISIEKRASLVRRNVPSMVEQGKDEAKT